jgi:two-component system phosphate regulon sensor histidine kinase PhoR
MKLSIRYKSIFVFSLIITMVLSGIYLAVSYGLKDRAYQRAKTHLLKDATLAKSFLAGYMAERPLSYGVDEVVDNIGKDLGMRVTVMGRYGTVIGDSELDGRALRSAENLLGRPEVREAGQSEYGEARRISATTKKETFYLALPFGEGKSRGIIRLAFPLSENELIPLRFKKLLAIMMFFAFGFGVFSVFAASMVILNPVEKSLTRMSAEVDLKNKELLTKSEELTAKDKKLNREESRFNAILDDMFDGTMVLDSKGNIALINQLLRRFLLFAENPLGKRPLEATGNNLEIQQIADEALKSKGGVISRQISVALPEARILSVHATPVLQEGKPKGAVLVFHDMTGVATKPLPPIKPEAKPEAKPEPETLPEPAATIKSYKETLLKKLKRNRKTGGENAGMTPRELSKKMLDKMKSKKIPAHAHKACSLNPVIDRAVFALKKAARKKSITISADYPKNLPRVLADGKKIARAFFNLIDNAIKNTPSGGRVIITAREKNAKFLQIDVSDTGVGISKKDLPHVFGGDAAGRPKKRPPKGKGKKKGTGLALVKDIIHSHNGSLTVKSIQGKGSTFAFTLPKA